jgi:hypothetical protein
LEEVSKLKTLNKGIHLFPVFVIILILLTGQTGCVRPGPGPVSDTSAEAADHVPEEVARTEPAIEKPTEDGIYDLEEEMPEDDELEGEESKEEDIEPIAVDTFIVEEAGDLPEAGSIFKIGYRIQILASGDLSRARELKKNVVAGTGLAVYIDFEDGMYKVRVGDYITRQEADGARKDLIDQYPDCWIVRTTIRKTE